MNKFFTIIIILTITLTSCAQSNNVVTPEIFEKGLTTKNIQILDVRTIGEYDKGHIKNALLADWNNQTEFNYRIAHIDKEKPLYIYCQAGGRSANANAYLQKMGFKNVIELKGGMIAWKQAKKNVEAASNEMQLTMQDYEKLIADTSKIYVVDFGAIWCAPCVQQKPIMEALQNELKDKFVLVNVDAGTHINLKSEMQVSVLPTIFIYKKGKQTMRFEGLTPKDLLFKEITK